MTVLLWFAVLLAVALVGYTVLGIYLLLTPTRGRRIDRASRPNEALLVIDLQSDFTRKTGKNGYQDAQVDRTLDSVNGLAAAAHASGVPVVSIRQVVTAPLAAFIGRILAGPGGIVGSPGIGLDPRLDLKADHDFTKHRGDAFSNPELERWLDSNRIGKLQIVGLDGCYCVRLTSLGALNRGYDVEIVENGVLAADANRWAECKQQLAKQGAAVVAGKSMALI
jgi:nicotinamidase-related amidase